MAIDQNEGGEQEQQPSPFLTSGLLAHATHEMGVELAQQCQQAQ
jgi:hypothetical protein